MPALDSGDPSTGELLFPSALFSLPVLFRSISSSSSCHLLPTRLFPTKPQPSAQGLVHGAPPDTHARRGGTPSRWAPCADIRSPGNKQNTLKRKVALDPTARKGHIPKCDLGLQGQWGCAVPRSLGVQHLPWALGVQRLPWALGVQRLPGLWVSSVSPGLWVSSVWA